MAAEMADNLSTLLGEVLACQICEPDLPQAPKPIFRLSTTAKILIIGQAPGRQAHIHNTPWQDASGQRLRAWLDMGVEEFYDSRHIAILPMDLCYPGTGPGGDLPPRANCAPLWHLRLLAFLPQIKMTLLVGGYAQRYYLEDKAKGGVTATVANWRAFAPEFFPLPHPSWRNTAWLGRHSWFSKELLPALRQCVGALKYRQDGEL
jgi:uracil-DNA glycosylase